MTLRGTTIAQKHLPLDVAATMDAPLFALRGKEGRVLGFHLTSNVDAGLTQGQVGPLGQDLHVGV